MKTRVTWLTAMTLMGAVLGGCGSIPAADPSGIMTVHSGSQTADVYLDAGYNTTNQWNNFDGYAHGRLMVTIPVGYTVRLHVTNDGGIPYALGVYDEVGNLAFKGAGNSIQDLAWNPSLGILPGDSATFTFTASRVGTYRMANYLYHFPAHNPANVPLGMWDTLRVVSSGSPNVSVL
ncbi:MAG: sulfocyanin-like copper-binding protein [Firmicutes bacterium]|nr:sulfocyanin-like copper-binding protein [Bacillota bacterium]